MIELTTERVGNNNDDDDRRLLEMLLETMICLRRALCCRRSNMIGHNVDASFQRVVFVVWKKLWSENLFEFLLPKKLILPAAERTRDLQRNAHSIQ